MIAVLVCDRDEREYGLISRDCRQQVAKNGDELLQMERLPDNAALAEAVRGEKQADLLYYDFQKGQALNELQSFRRQYSGAMVMLIADPAVSPLEYLRPGVAPDSLLLRPVDEAQLQRANTEFMDSFFERFRDNRTESSFVVDTREEKLFIPYAHIYYFEARDKKLFVRVRDAEYAFYDTMDALEKCLPEGFRRCHRSYIVNTRKVVRIRLAENYIELKDRIGVPVSRSYKASFQDMRL